MSVARTALFCSPRPSLTPQQERMVEDNIGLVTYVLKHYTRDIRYEWDDAYQYGCLGLVDAVCTYDPGKGFAFSTYANKCIYRNIKRWEAYNTRKKNSFGRNTTHVSFDRKNDALSTSNTLHEKLLPVDYVTPEEAYIRKELVSLIKAYMSTFPQDAQTALWYVSILRVRTAREMGLELGMDAYDVQRMIKKYMRMLRIFVERKCRHYV